MIEYKSGERLGYIKKSPHSPECVSSIWICLNYVISKNILLICQKTSLQLPVDIFPYLNGGYATDNIAKITP